MRQLPPSIQVAIVVAALVVCALCAAVLAAVLRPRARQRIARWPATFLLELVTLAIVPWLVVVFAPITISANIHGVVPLVGWILLALFVFGLLVLLPVAAVASSVVWLTARRRRDRSPTQHPRTSDDDPPTASRS